MREVKKLALLIGSAEYQDQQLRRLKAPAADVSALRRVLIRPDIGGFAEADVIVLPNPGKADAERALTRLFLSKGRQKDDLVLFYFSGHGVLDHAGDLFLALPHSEYEDPHGTMLWASQVKTIMDRSPSRRVVVILDCCHSGAFQRSTKSGHGPGSPAVTEATFEPQGYGREVLTSSALTQYAYDGDELLGDGATSLFTRYLIQGLETGEAAPGSEMISVEQLFRYVYRQVVGATPKMTPQRWVDAQMGSLIIARNPEPWAGAIPAAMSELLDDDRPLVR